MTSFARQLCVLTLAMLAMPCWAAHGGKRVLPIAGSVFPPYEYYSSDGKVIGAETETIEQIVTAIGHTPNMQLTSWTRAQALGEKGMLAAVFSMLKTPEREKHFYFSEPIGESASVFFKRKDRAIKWNSLDDVAQLRIGMSSGYAYPDLFQQAVEKGKFKSLQKTAAAGLSPEMVNLRNLMLGRTDLFICDISVCEHMIKTNSPEFDELDFIPKVIGDVMTVHVGFSRKWPGAEQITKDFNTELKRFIHSGQHKKVYDKYHATPWVKMP